MNLLLLASLTLLGTCQALNTRHVWLGTRSQDDAASIPSVPLYNMSLPVDHFDPSNNKTFENIYYVNDTYYKPGGPVILFDLGESGFSPDQATAFLAEVNTTSAPMRLAARTNGLVIGWEHRYYGHSRPVPLDDETGLPVDGVEGYKYLTVEQALADAAFFANRFNTTSLGLNSNIKNTSNLDPYHAPWIFMGGSYPGLRAAWARNQYPEVFYASWASSAPVQAQEDGSIYFDPIVRSMPQNCTNDIKAAVAYLDQTLESSSDTGLEWVKTAVYIAKNDTADLNDLSPALGSRIIDVAGDLANALSFGSSFQSFGPAHTTRAMCDFMQGFDVKNFTGSNVGFRNQSRSIQEQIVALYNNPGGVAPTEGGIAAANPQNGGAYAFAALIHGIIEGKKAFNAYQWTLPGGGAAPFTEQVDSRSWSWQSLTQLGFFQGSNPDHITVISKFYNYTAVQDDGFKGGDFASFAASSLPSRFDPKELARGGWNINASNVMFTNGEFDPWRAFSVASQVDAAPKRNVVQTVPKCNAISDGNNAFGLTFAGAVHVEDMSTFLYQRGSQEQKTPLDQGLDLFMSAWDTWLPCFNKSRDDMRNGLGVDGSRHAANGTLIKGDGALGASVSMINILMSAAVAIAFTAL